MMRIGVKTFDNEKFLKNFEKKVDFFEKIRSLDEDQYLGTGYECDVIRNDLENTICNIE